MSKIAAGPQHAMPATKRPIAIIGAGGIVRAAHLPAYRKAGFNVIGILDVLPEKATALAAEFGIPQVLARDPHRGDLVPRRVHRDDGVRDASAGRPCAADPDPRRGRFHHQGVRRGRPRIERRWSDPDRDGSLNASVSSIPRPSCITEPPREPSLLRARPPPRRSRAAARSRRTPRARASRRPSARPYCRQDGGVPGSRTRPPRRGPRS
jgi:hypothetical protein